MMWKISYKQYTAALLPTELKGKGSLHNAGPSGQGLTTGKAGLMPQEKHGQYGDPLEHPQEAAKELSLETQELQY